MGCVGFLFGKKQYINDASVKSLNGLVLYVAIPCVILRSFQVPYQTELMHGLLMCMGSAAILMLLFYCISGFLVKKLPEDQAAIYRLSCTLTNSGTLGLPLQNAILGNMGSFYGSGYVAVMNMLNYSLGVYCLSKGRQRVTIKQILLQPAIISIGLSVALFLGQVQLPTILSETVQALAQLCTPLSMILMGYHLSKKELSHIFKSSRNWIFAFVRLVALPAVALGVLHILGIRGDLLTAMMTAAACPPASAVMLLTSRCGRNEELAAEINAMYTILSILTVPVIAAISMSLA